MKNTTSPQLQSHQPLIRHSIEQLLTVATFVLIGLLLIFYGYFVYCFSVNFPFQDDNSFTLLIYKLKENRGWAHTLNAFLRPENDHRLVIPRLVGYIHYLLTGGMNFKTYIIVANLAILVTLYEFYRIFRIQKLPTYYFLPVPFMLLQHQHHEITGWALTGVQHSFLILFSLTSLRLLNQSKSRILFGLAILFAILATFTHGNGIVAFGAGAFLLLCQKAYQKLIIWLLFLFLCLILYLTGYTPGSGVNSVFVFTYALGTFLALIGGNIAVWPPVAIPGSILWGTIICLVFLPFIFQRLLSSFIGGVVKTKRNEKAELLLLTTFCFIALTIALIAVFRSNGNVLLPSRFMIYSAMASIITYLFLLTKTPSRLRCWCFVGFTGFAFYFAASSYYFFTQIAAAKKSSYVADSYNWRHHRVLASSIGIANSYYFLLPAYRDQYWQVPDFLPGFDSLYQHISTLKSRHSFRFSVQQINDNESNGRKLLIKNKDIPFRKTSFRDEICLILTNEATRATYLLGTSPRITGKRTILVKSYFQQGFESSLPIGALPKGRYRLGAVHITETTPPDIRLSDTFLAVE